MKNDHKGEHANKNSMHKDKLNCDISVPEGSLCDDTFASNEEYTEHVNKTHLNEIQKVDFDDLKNLHEVFECSLCVFSSTDSERVKIHLTDHSLEAKVTIQKEKKNIKSRKKPIYRQPAPATSMRILATQYLSIDSEKSY